FHVATILRHRVMVEIFSEQMQRNPFYNQDEKGARDMNTYFEDRVAVVTGGASGIGLALAETMLSYGVKQVNLADFNEENLKREAARLNTAIRVKWWGFAATS